MQHSEIWQDINITIQRAINEGLHQADEAHLIDRSDALLTSLPVMGGQQPTTALLLRRYQRELHQELCAGQRPRATFNSVEDELREMSRAVIVTLDTNEGVSIENAVLIALVLRARGLTTFCAQPTVTPRF